MVDTAKGSRNKYKFEPSTGQWHLSKMLPQGMAFPYNFGFIPSTKGEDGDPIDVLLLMDEPAFSGCVVPARLIGVIEAEQTEHGEVIRNDRLIATIATSCNPAEYESLKQVSRQRLDEIEDFFVAYNAIEGREFRPLGRHGPKRAQQLLERAVRGKGARRKIQKALRGAKTTRKRKQAR
ncbi:MAG TPA: inorganic diphosphatase [Pirellulales bacterium]|nr:inorganic diphosphatase [Pirellulales bacterium]